LFEEFGPDLFVSLIDAYLGDTPNRFGQMRAALDGGDRAALAREAHTLKSSSANVEAITLSIMVNRKECDARWRNS